MTEYEERAARIILIAAGLLLVAVLLWALAGRDDALLAVAADSRLADADGAWHGCAAWLLDAAGWYGWLAGDGEPSPALPEATRRNTST